MDSKEIKDKAYSLGFDLCGVASVDRFTHVEPISNPASVLPGCRSVIVVARRFLASTTKSASTVPYTIIRNLLSMDIDLKTIELSMFIEDHNYLAIPTGAIEPCNYNSDLKKTVGLISLKFAAYQAGLGVIGRNTLLITPKFGNMVWLGAVLTSAELKPDPIQEKNPCKASCSLCIANCPVKALDGSEFMDQRKCWNYAFGEPAEGGEWRIKCFRCRTICPYSGGF